jgi:hypothetical protein
MEIIIKMFSVIFCLSMACICIFKPNAVARFLKMAYTPHSKIINKTTGIEPDLNVRKPLIQFAGFTLFLFALLVLFASVNS